MAEILSFDNRATVGLVVFAVFAISTFGEKLLERAFGVRALVAGSIGLIAGMGLLALGIAVSSLPFLVAGGIVVGLGQGASFRHGLAALNDASGGATRRGRIESFRARMPRDLDVSRSEPARRSSPSLSVTDEAGAVRTALRYETGSFENSVRYERRRHGRANTARVG